MKIINFLMVVLTDALLLWSYDADKFSYMSESSHVISVDAENTAVEISNFRDISTKIELLAARRSVEIEFVGRVNPPKTYFYSYTLRGVTYEGTLKLESFSYIAITDKTVAIYSGEFDPIR